MGTKSDLLHCLEALVATDTSADIDVSVKIVDGAAIVNMIKPKGAQTFEEYANVNFLPYVLSQLQGIQRLDVVWDVYPVNSLKEQARESRGIGARRRVLAQTIIPKNWASFLRNNDNKTELFCFLSEKCSQINVGQKELYTTKLDHVLTAHSCDNYSKFGIEPCNHEEADTRMLLHAAHAARQGHSKLLLRTVDTDVVVLAVSHAHLIGVTELWIAFGVGKHYRLIAAHSIASAIGSEKVKALPFFHALTGCDTTSTFAGRGKKTAWDIWTVFPNVTPAFISLSAEPQGIANDLLETIEHYVVLLYCKTSSTTSVNEARQMLFAKGARTLENIPPTQGALLQHVKRAAFQAGHVWGQALQSQQELPSPADWGWNQTEYGWTPNWTSLPEASKACHELVHCGCKKACHGRCKCLKASLTCTALCACHGHCSRQDD